MPSLKFLNTFLAFSLFLQSTTAERKCYALNGTELSEAYAPCGSNGKHSGCCATKRSGGSADMCLSNGLCMATNDEYMGTIWQSGCTDPTGMDPSCPKMCPDARNDFNNGTAVAAWNIQTCDFGTYCCREAGSSENCCADSKAPRITTKSIGSFNFDPSKVSSLSSTPTSSASSTTMPTEPLRVSTVTTSSPTPDPICNSTQHQTAVVGAVLGSIFGAALLSLLGIIYHLYQKEKRQRRLKEHYESQFATTSWSIYGKSMGSRRTSVEPDRKSEGSEKEMGMEVRFIGRERSP